MAKNVNGSVYFGIGLDNDQLRRDAAQSQKILQGVGNTAVAEGARIDTTFRNIARSAGLVFGAQQAMQFARSIVQVRGEMQMLEKSFDVLLQSEEKSAKMLSEIRALATESPLEMTHVSQAAQTLLGFGVDAEKVMGIVRQLSDVSMGNSDRFRSLALVYAQTQAAGKLMGQDLLQMINAGFNPLQVISEQTGKSISVLKEEMSSGAISAQMVADAFTAVTSEGGKFYQMTQKQASGIVGLKASFQDAITMMFNELGEANEGVIADAIKGATYLVENYEKVGRILAVLVGSYGAYRAALIATVAIQKAVAAVEMIKTFNQTTQALTRMTQAQILLNKVVGNNPYIKLASILLTVGGLIWAFAKNSKEATETTKRLDEATKDLGTSIESETAVLDLMFRRLEKATEGTDEYAAAKKAIFDKYGSYLSSMTEEQRSLLTTTELYNTLAEAIKNAATARAQEQFITDAATAKSNRQSEALKSLDAYLKGELGNGAKADELFLQLRNILERSVKGGVDGNQAFFDFYDLLKESGAYNEKQQIELSKILEDYQYANVDYKKAVKDAEKYFVTDGTVSVATGFDAAKASIDELTKELPNAKAKLEAMVKAGDDQAAIDKQKLLVDTINAQIQARIKAGQTSKAYWEAEKTRISGELEGLLEIDRQGEKGAKLRAELAKVEQRLQTWNPKENTEKQGEELADLRAQLASDFAQAEIDAIDDGFAKRMAQLRRNHELERVAIEANYAELVKLQGGELTAEQQGQKTLVLGFVDDRFRSDAKAEQDAVLNDMMTFTQKYQKIITDTNAKIKEAQMAGASLDMFGVLSEQENELINRLAEEYSTKSKDYEDFMRSMADASVEEIHTQIAAARAVIQQIIVGGIDEEEIQKYLGYIARLNALQDQLKKEKLDTSPDKKSDNDWKKLYSTLQKVEKEFNDIGDAIGGTAGEIIKTAGTVSANTLQIIDGITSLSKTSSQAIEGVSKTAATAIKAVEQASVILAIIGAVMKVIQKLSTLFKSNEEELRNVEKATIDYIASLRKLEIQSRIDLFDSVFGENALGKFKEATSVVGKMSDTIIKQRSDFENASRNPGNYQLGFWDKTSIKELEDQADGVIQAVFDGRSKLSKALNINKKKVKTYTFDINDYVNADGSMTQKQLEALQLWYDSYKNGLSKSERAYLEELINNGEIYVDAVEQQNEYLSSLFGNLSNDIASNMIDAFLEIGDAGANLEEVMDDVARNIVQSFVEASLMEKYFTEDLKKTVSDLIEKGDVEGATKAIQEVISEIERDAKNWEEVFERIGLGDAATEARTSASQGFAQASQDSIDKIDGILTNIENHTYGIFELMKSSVPGADNASGYFANLEAPVIGIAEMMRTNQRIQQANTDAMLGHLSAIHNNTNRLEAVENHLMNANRRLVDISDGITQLNRS